ncbi:unnamed protein product [Brachionus calyciflorus]|uniref:Uncharacterized protein n=1 Tax=Brachionus calyciflorus TaxID=104777 RepID=A0A813VA08_9BILA|nr:unnamed protein product [Brachionus calyciflorus]
MTQSFHIYDFFESLINNSDYNYKQLVGKKIVNNDQQTIIEDSVEPPKVVIHLNDENVHKSEIVNIYDVYIKDPEFKHGKSRNIRAKNCGLFDR